MAKGIITYVPPSVIEELDVIRQRKKMAKRADAFRALVSYSRVGREAEDILSLRFTNGK